MKKTKILMISDHALSTSGVAIQSKYLIEGLINTGKYEIIQVGAARYHENMNPLKVNENLTIIPCVGFGDKDLVRSILMSELPDALILFTDIRFFTHIWDMEDEIHEVCPILYWHVWDNNPYPSYNEYVYNSVDKINCISYLTYDLLKSRFRDKTEYIPHALPQNDFYRFDKEEIIKYKRLVLQDKKDWFLCLWVNRNIRRKRPADVLKSWQIFLNNLKAKENHKKALLIMHTNPVDESGTNLIEVAKHLKIEDNVRFSKEELGFKELNMLHNISDVCLNISFAEGFGLSTLQSLYTGTPIIVCNTGGLNRQVYNSKDKETYGEKIEPKVKTISGVLDTPFIEEDYVCVYDVADALYKMFKLPKRQLNILQEKSVKYVKKEFNMQSLINKWDNSIQNVIQEKSYKNRIRIKEFN
jgi:glycosyltransferase involved in cell wall biosynthesis